MLTVRLKEEAHSTQCNHVLTLTAWWSVYVSCPFVIVWLCTHGFCYYKDFQIRNAICRLQSRSSLQNIAGLEPQEITVMEVCSAQSLFPQTGWFLKTKRDGWVNWEAEIHSEIANKLTNKSFVIKRHVKKEKNQSVQTVVYSKITSWKLTLDWREKGYSGQGQNTGHFTCLTFWMILNSTFYLAAPELYFLHHISMKPIFGGQIMALASFLCSR